ncbi:hypothetical protein D3C86_1829160 [compost metagenome]
MVGDDLRQLVAGSGQCRIPADRYRLRAAREALQGLQQSRLARDFGRRREVQRAALGAQLAEVRGV